MILHPIPLNFLIYEENFLFLCIMYLFIIISLKKYSSGDTNHLRYIYLNYLNIHSREDYENLRVAAEWRTYTRICRNQRVRLSFFYSAVNQTNFPIITQPLFTKLFTTVADQFIIRLAITHFSCIFSGVGTVTYEYMSCDNTEHIGRRLEKRP